MAFIVRKHLFLSTPSASESFGKQFNNVTFPSSMLESGVNALLLLTHITTHHTKLVLNYEYFSSAQIMHIFEIVLALENVMRL